MIMKLIIGKTYLIKAQRKGIFMMRVKSQCDTWTEGTVVGGETEAMLEHNICTVGEDVSCRTSFILSAVEQPE